MFKSINLIIAVAVCIACIPGCDRDDPQTSRDVTAGDVQEEMSEAAKTTGAYLNKEKDDVLKWANESYTELERDTKALISKMKQSGKESWQASSNELSSKLDVAQAKYNDLKRAGNDNLGDARDAFEEAVEDLKDAYKKAKDESLKDNNL